MGSILTLRLIFLNTLLSLDFAIGLKCYVCVYWNGPSVPHNIQHVSHKSCGKGNKPESRFIQECVGDQICAVAHVEFKDFRSPKSISSRRCIPPDSLLQSRCTPLKTMTDLYSLYESSRIVKFGKSDAVKDGIECGCNSDLCNSSRGLRAFVWMSTIQLLVNVLWYNY